MPPPPLKKKKHTYKTKQKAIPPPIIFKLQRIKIKKDSWKKPGEEKYLTHRGAKIRITSNLSLETMQAKGNRVKYLG